MRYHDAVVRRAGSVAMVAAGALAVAGCGPKHRLADYDFAGRTLAAVHTPSPYPQLRTGPVRVAGLDDPLQAVVDAGSRVVMEVEARRARARLDSAAVRVDVAERMARRAVERGGRYLGTRPEADANRADYLLELHVREFGLDARRWDAAAQLFVRAEAVLMEARTGAEIWSIDINGWKILTPAVLGTGPVPREIVTAAALTTVSVEEMERVLETIADFSADLIAEELREALRKVRRR